MFPGGMNAMNFVNPGNFSINNQNINLNQAEDWLIIFETKPSNNKISIQISSADTVSSAFSKYRLKAMENDTPLKFAYKGKPLDPKLTLSGSGLTNNATITVETIKVPKPNQILIKIIYNQILINGIYFSKKEEKIIQQMFKYNLIS